MLTIDQAIHHLRQQEQFAELVRDAYLGADLQEAARRFAASAEFAAVRSRLAGGMLGRTVLDLGAGNGIASYAFAVHGAARVYAVEPDPSQEVGRGAIARATVGLQVTIIDARAEQLPLPAETVDIVYGRQVLHHIGDLPAALRECARVLKRGGWFFACREHVVTSRSDLRQFLANHPLHQLTGGENAYRLREYVQAIRRAGLIRTAVLPPWKSVINTFPAAHSDDDLKRFPRCLRTSKVGKLVSLGQVVPGLNRLLWRHLTARTPGRMYSFLAQKP